MQPHLRSKVASSSLRANALDCPTQVFSTLTLRYLLVKRSRASSRERAWATAIHLESAETTPIRDVNRRALGP